MSTEFLSHDFNLFSPAYYFCEISQFKKQLLLGYYYYIVIELTNFKNILNSHPLPVVGVVNISLLWLIFLLLYNILLFSESS